MRASLVLPLVLSMPALAAALQTPANDDFANAATLTGPAATATGTNAAATFENMEPSHAGSGPLRSVWWTWVAPSTTVVMSTQGSDFDTVLAVYQGTAVNALSGITSNDDESPFVTSRVSFSAAAGQTYRIAVDGFNGATGQIRLSITPPNDDSANAIVLSGFSPTGSGANVGATKQSGEANHGGNAGGSSVWWRWVSPLSGTAAATTAGSSFNTLLGVYDAAMAPLGQDDDAGPGTTSQVSFAVAAGATYFFAVDGFNAGTWPEIGTVSIGITTASSPPANDAFAGAVALSGASPAASGTNVGASKEAAEPAHAGNPGGRSVWWSWTAPTTDSYLFSTEGSSFDTTLGIYIGSSIGGLILTAQDNDGGPNGTSRVTFRAAAGQLYRIAVDGFNADGAVAAGAVQLRITRVTSVAGGGGAPAPDDDSDEKCGSLGADLLLALWALRRARRLFATSAPARSR